MSRTYSPGPTAYTGHQPTQRYPHRPAQPSNLSRAASLANGTQQQQLPVLSAEQRVAQLALQSLAAKFGGASQLFMDGPYHSNRLLLSLKSGLPDEVDFALERFLHITYVNAGLVPLSHFVGLAEALLHIIDGAYQSRAKLPTFAASFPISQQDAQIQRRAVEAATVLRNIALETRNMPTLSQLKSRLLLICQNALQYGVSEEVGFSFQRQELVEIQICLLEILECVAPEIKLSSPYSIVSTLSSHTFSSDRALILGAFRVLAGLANNTSSTSEHNSAAFAMPANASLPNAITRALELLPIQDVELSIAILDLLYSYTQIPTNAATVCERPDLQAILRILFSKLAIGGQREDLEVEPPKDRLNRLIAEQRSRDVSVGGTAGDLKIMSAKLPNDELASLVFLKEPLRTQRWMQWAYEGVTDAEVTQVILWTSYKEQFENINSTDNKMLAAADVIKHSTDAFTAALPMISETDRKFIIRGIQTRDRQELAELLRRKWTSVPEGTAQPVFSNSTPLEIYGVPPPTMAAKPANASNSQILQGALAILIASGIPPPPISAWKEAEAASRPSAVEQPFHFQYATWTISVDAQGQMVGPAFLAMLVIRNIARAVKASVPPKGREIDTLGPSIFTVLAGEGNKADVAAQGSETVPIQAFEKAKGALNSFEADLLELAAGCRQLAEYVGEVLEVIGVLKELAPISM